MSERVVHRGLTEAEIETVAAAVASKVEEAVNPSSLPFPVWVEGIEAAQAAKRRLREAEARTGARRLSGRLVPVPQYTTEGQYLRTDWLPAESVTIGGRPALEVLAEREKAAAATKLVESRPRTKLVQRRGGWARVPA